MLAHAIMKKDSKDLLDVVNDSLIDRLNSEDNTLQPLSDDANGPQPLPGSTTEDQSNILSSDREKSRKSKSSRSKPPPVKYDHKDILSTASLRRSEQERRAA